MPPSNSTNFDYWKLYCQHLPSPELFIDFGFTFMVAAALQRRTWAGGEHHPMYFNQYCILCGPPGAGKGMVINTIKDFLTYNKAYAQKGFEDATDLFFNKGSKAPNGKEVLTASPIQFSQGYSQEAGNLKKDFRQEPLLFPMASESMTFQAFVKSFMDSMAGGFYVDNEGVTQKFYYCSLFMCLEELASIFQQDERKIIRLIVKLYDCKNTSYETLSRKLDLITNPCFNFMAGTTAEFIQDTVDENLVGEGWNSRLWYIYEHSNRFQKLLLPELTVEQKMAKAELISHLRLLSKVKGPSKFTPEALNYLSKWWEEHPKMPRVNSSPKLNHYYSRKQLHLMKLAGAIHYGEITNENDRTIGLWAVKKAESWFNYAERNMHLALSFRHKNPLADVGKKVENLLKVRGFLTFNEIFESCIEDCRKHELEEVIGNLQTFKKIERVKNKAEKEGYKMV